MDNVGFTRPIVTVSLLSEQEMVLGEHIRLVSDGVFEGEFRLRLPPGSAVALRRHAANVSRHAVPAVTARRISFTLRRLD